MIVKNVEKKEHSTAVFQVEVDAEAFENAIGSAYRKAKGSIFVAGFRKGKAPRVVIEGMYGANVFHDDAVQIIAPDAFEFGIGEAKLDSVGAPSIVDYEVSADKVLTITFSTEIYPEVTLGAYKGLEAEYEEPEVSDEEVAAELESTRKRNARFVDVERPVQSGDTIVFDFEGFVDGEAFAGGKSEGYTLEIGSGAFIPGFEDGLIGMEAEKDGEVAVTFPDNYDEKLSGKNAVFKVKIHNIREPHYPALDDEFAKDVSEFDTLEEYTKNVRETMLEKRRQESDRKYKSALMTAAVGNMTCDVPGGMVAEKTDEFLRNYADSMGMRGNISRADLIKTLGVDEQSFAQMVRPNAVQQVKADLLLDAVVAAEKIEIPQEEKDEFFKKIEEDYGPEAEKVKGMISEALMVRDLSRQKAAELIYDSGVKTAPAKEEPAKEEPAEEKSEAPKKPRARSKKAAAESAPEEEKQD